MKFWGIGTIILALVIATKIDNPVAYILPVGMIAMGLFFIFGKFKDNDNPTDNLTGW